MKRFLLPLIVASLTLTGCSTAANESNESDSEFTVSGTVTLAQERQGKAGERCVGHGGYSDMAAGTSIEISDNSGAVVALGRLGEGKTANPNGTWTLTKECVFPFEVHDVIGGGKIYGVEVSDRGVVMFDIENASDVHLVLG